MLQSYCAGNLTINGTTTTLNTATLDIEDKTLCIAKGAADAAAANGAGLIVDGASACLCYTSGTDSWDFNKKVILDGAGSISNNSSNFVIKSEVNNADLLIKGNDAGVEITPITLDMSSGGQVITNVSGSTVAKWQRTSGGSIVGELTLGFPSGKATFNGDNDLVFAAAGGDICLNNNTTIIGNISAGNFAGNNEIALTRTTSSPSSIKLQAHSNEPKIMFGTNGAGNYGLRFADDSDNVLMKLTTSGNLGVGNSTPGRNLSVFKSDYPTIQLINSTSSNGSADGAIIQLHHTDMDLVIRNPKKMLI